MSARLHLEGAIEVPYRWPAGQGGGRYLAALAEGRFVGARLRSGRVVVPPPAADVDGAPVVDWVDVGPGGDVVALTVVTRRLPGAPPEPPFGVALVRLDGADTAMPYLVEGRELDQARSGGRIVARPRAVPTQGCPPAVAGAVRLRYRWAYGENLSRFFAALRDERRLLGARCPSCGQVACPPPVACARCYLPLESLCDVGPQGAVEAVVENRLDYPDQPRPPPYLYAAIRLDGADSVIHHVLGEVDRQRARRGLKVEPVFAEARDGSWGDIVHFRPVR